MNAAAIGKLQYGALIGVVRRLARMRPGAATVNGRRVPYFVRRGRDPILFVHGFGADKEGWLLLAALVDPRRGVVIPDLPGFGAADAIPPEAASPAAYAQSLACVLDDAGVDRAHVVGSSMGGGISLALAGAHAARVRSLALLGSVGPSVDKSEVEEAFARGENPLVIRSARDMESFLKLVAEKPVPATRAMLTYIAAQRVARAEDDARLFGGWAKATVGLDIAASLRALRVPTLVVHGARDRVIHPSTGRALAAGIAGARLEIMEGVGHAPQMEAPLAVGLMLERFWRKLPS